MDIIYTASSLPGMEVLSCLNDRQFKPHLHDGYVLWLNSESGERYSIAKTSDILQPGSISIIEPGVIHENRPCQEKRRHLKSFYFTPQFLAKMAEQIGDGETLPALPTTIITDKRLWRDASRLHDALFHPLSILQSEVGILSLFNRLFTSCRLLPSLGLVKDDNRKVAVAIEYFVANLHRQFHLAEVAHLAGCTDFHLIRLFRAIKGVSPHTYLVQLRLEHARKLLLAGFTIVDAALQSGFSDQSHLTRFFRERFGLTPGQYRKQRLRD